jgi:hypothetical protein
MSRERIPIIKGAIYGRLTIIGPTIENSNTLVNVRCECGVEKTVGWANVHSGNTCSCGCRAKSKSTPRKVKHPIVVGAVYGYLTVLGPASPDSNLAVNVRCQCGVEKTISWRPVYIGEAQSCGCQRSKLIATHGHSFVGKKSPLYYSWSIMRSAIAVTMKNRRKALGYSSRIISMKTNPKWETFEGYLEDFSDWELKSNEAIFRADRSKPWSKENSEIKITKRKLSST